jgi:hypothetical protein
LLFVLVFQNLAVLCISMAQQGLSNVLPVEGIMFLEGAAGLLHEPAFSGLPNA